MSILKSTKAVQTKNQKSRGQTMVEFALILPILLITLFTLVELARVLHAWMAVENGARFGVRYAVTGEYDPSTCPGGVCSNDTERKNARLDSIYRAAEAGSASILRDFTVTDVTENGFFKVTVCDPDLLISPSVPTEEFQCQLGEDPGDPGDQVTVVVEFTHPLITPIISGIVPNLHISSKRDATVETFRVVQAGGGAPGSDPPESEPPAEPPEPPNPFNPCDNLIIGGLDLDDKFASPVDDRMWKLEFALYNNNYIAGTITRFELNWDRPADLDLLRFTYRYKGTSSPQAGVSGKKSSGPVVATNLPFPAGQPPLDGMPTMYGEFCVDNNHCNFDEDYMQSADRIASGDYTFWIDMDIDFDGYDTCPVHLSLGPTRAAARSGGGGGGGDDPFDPPDPPPGGGEPPGGGGGDPIVDD